MSIAFQSVQPFGAHSPAQKQLCLPIVLGTVLSWWFPEAEVPVLMDWFIRLETDRSGSYVPDCGHRSGRRGPFKFSKAKAGMLPGF